MSVLHLVRHATPDASPEVPAASWPLSPEGRSDAALLAARLPAGAVVVASPALRAVQTVAPLADPARDERFAEVRRDEAWSDDFRATRRAYVDGAVVPGWEPQERVARRFDEGVRTWLERGDADLVVASHGMAITVWLAARGLLGPGAAGEFWTSLTLPDCWVLPRDLGSLARLAAAP